MNNADRTECLAVEDLMVALAAGELQAVRLLALPNGYLACWDVAGSGGAELRLARLDQQGRLISSTSLVRSRTPITSFDLKSRPGKDESGVILLWSEVRPGGALTFTQQFSMDGQPLDEAKNLFVADTKPSAVVFGNAEARSLIWPEPSRSDGIPAGIRPIAKSLLGN